MPVFTALWHLGAGVYPYPMNRLRRQPFPAPLEAITIRWIQLIVNVSYTAGLRGGPLTHVLIRSVLLFGQSTSYTYFKGRSPRGRCLLWFPTNARSSSLEHYNFARGTSCRCEEDKARYFCVRDCY